MSGVILGGKKLQLNDQVFLCTYKDIQEVYRADYTNLDEGGYISLKYYREISNPTTIGDLTLWSDKVYIFGFKLDDNDNVTDVGLTTLQDSSVPTGYVKPSDLIGYTFENASPSTYVITFDAKGGNGGPTSQIKIWNEDLIISSDTPTRLGYTFLHWSTTEDGNNGTSYSPGASFSINEDITLYAQWTANIYDVVYHGNGGVLSNDANIWLDQATYGIEYTVKPFNLFSKEGYTFIGWSTETNVVDPSWQNWQGQNRTWDYTNDVSLYALWMPNPSNIKLFKSGTDIEISKLRYRDDIDIICDNDDSLPTFTIGENGQESGTSFYIEDSYGHKVKNINAVFGEDNVHVGKISDISDIEATSTIRIFVQNFVTLWGNSEDRTYISDSGRSYYLNNSGILRIQTGNTNNSWKEGQVYVKTNDGWKEASTVYVKTDTGWKEST